MDTTLLMLSLLFSAFGMAYFVYGKKQRNPVALFAGICLCIFPYFVPGTVLMIVIGVALITLPFVIKF